MFDKGYFNTGRLNEASTMRIIDRKGEYGLFVPLKETRLTGTIDGPLASLTLTQVFSGVDKGDEVIEAIYRFPLPGDGAVHDVAVSFGDTRVEAKLAERKDAQETYEKAREDGDQAVFIEKEGEDVFTLHVSGLVPGEEVKIETTFSLWMRPRLEGLEFRFPLTIGPRYTRGDEGARGRKKNPLKSAWDPGHRFGMYLFCRGVGMPESETYLVGIEEAEDGFRLSLDDVHPDQDCVLRFPLIREAGKASLRVSHYKENERTWFMAMAVPPENALPEKGLQVYGREIIVLMDKSGSMEGPKWIAATEALKGFLKRMDEKDHLNIGFFENQTRWIFKRPVQGGRRSVDLFLSDLDKERPGGGTELGVALEQALKMPKTGTNLARHVLIVTDAQVTDSERIFRLVEEHAKGADPRKVSIICIDAAPNSPLVSGIAERGRGEAYYLTSDPEEDELVLALEEIFKSWSRPLVRGLILEAEGQRAFDAAGFLQAGKRDGNPYIELGDLPSEKHLVVCGFIDGLKDPGRITLKDSKGNLLAESGVSSGGSPSVRRLCGAARIRRLEALLDSRYGNEESARVIEAMGFERPENAKTLYSENLVEVVRETVESLIRSESLAAGVISVETSFIAVSTRGDGKVDVIAEVPNALPRGWDTAFRSARRPQYRRMESRICPSDAIRSMVSRFIDYQKDKKCLKAERSHFDPGLFQSSIESGDIRTVECLLRIDPERVDEKLPIGLSPLEMAIKTGNTDMAGFLAGKGASLEKVKPQLNDWILEAVEKGDLRMVEILLKFGADPDSIYGGETLLMHACVSGAGPGIIHLLIQAGADINARDRDGVSVLMKAAARCRDLEILRMLLDAGADPCIRSRNGETAFHRLLDRMRVHKKNSSFIF